MRKMSVALVTMFALALSAPVFADWEITFGKDNNQVGLKAPVGAEDLPVGPASYRMVNGSLWLLDSANGKILCFDSADKLTFEISIPGINGKKDFILDDFAVQEKNGSVEGIIVVESLNRQISKFDKTGKALFSLKIDSAQLIQMDQIEVDANGQFYVGDFAKSHIAVFSPEGKFLRSVPWQCSGFALDKNNNLHLLNFRENIGHSHIIYSSEGKELKRTEIGMPEMQNPRIWHVDKNDEFLISFVPPEGDPNSHLLFSFSNSGEILNKASFKNPYYINRYLMAENGAAWLVSADYTNQNSKIRISAVK